MFKRQKLKITNKDVDNLKGYMITLEHGHVGNNKALELTRFILAKDISDAVSAALNIPRVKKKMHHIKEIRQTDDISEIVKAILRVEFSNIFKDNVISMAGMTKLFWVVRQILNGRLKKGGYS